jgi:predicted RNase H-like HicB family nuclease
MKRFLIVIEKTKSGFSLHIRLTFPAVLRQQQSKSAVEKNIRESIQFHIEGLRKEGYPIPKPTSYSSFVEVPA